MASVDLKLMHFDAGWQDLEQHAAYGFSSKCTGMCFQFGQCNKQSMGLYCWPVYAAVQHCFGNAEDVCANNIPYSRKFS